jgi:PAS domain S-box-containing protein
MHSPGSATLLSNLAQLVLGILMVLAMLEAGKRSGRFGYRTWLLTAIAAGIYTVGQAFFTYWSAGSKLPDGAVIYDPIFFFWAVPLVAAAVADPAEIAEGFEWSSILDFSLLVLLALAMHFSAFLDTLRWYDNLDAMLIWKFKVRLIRDLIVLACLWGRYFFSESKQVRAIFLRVGAFYSAYALCTLVSLLARLAQHSVKHGTALDLVWSAPRLLAIVLAATWNWREELEVRPSGKKWRGNVLNWAPLIVPLLVLAVGWHMFSAAPWIWAGLIAAALIIVSVRLWLTQSHHESALAAERASNNLLHAIIESSGPVYLKDTQGRYLLVNRGAARCLNRPIEEVVGKLDSEVFLPEEAAVIRKVDREVMRSGGTLTMEHTVKVRGKPRIYLTTKNAYRDPQGRIIGVVGISVDITARRRMEEHLQRSQRMESIGTFSSGIAHDFNNLLTVVKGYSYLAHAQADGNPFIRESVDQINKATARASGLIDQLLAFSRQKILQPHVINLNDTISHLRKMLDRLIGEDVRIQTQLAADLGAVKADPCQIEQVLMNLAANARDAMPKGGTLSLETANVILKRKCGSDIHVPSGDYVCLTVRDTGIGMDQRTRTRIFEPFFTTKPAGKGTGLGLSTVYGIVKQSGGYLDVDSEPEAGATFRIYLPRVNEPVECLTQITARPAPCGGHQTILVVDDDAQVRQLAKKVLTMSGFKVLEADGGEQAERLAALHEGAIDVLLTDVVMPGASGSDVARQICGAKSKTRVLFMSGYPNDIIAHHGMLNPEISLLQKPFSPAGLLEKVQEVLRASGDQVAV